MYDEVLALAIKVLISIVGFFVVYWIKEIRDDLKGLIGQLQEHDKRIDKLEAFRREITSIHNSQHPQAPILPPNGK